MENLSQNSKISITRISRSSWFKITFRGLVIHLDPGYAGFFRNQGIPVIELEAKADIILVSHCHKDHLQPEALGMIRDSDTAVVAPESCCGRAGDTIFAEAGKIISMKGICIMPVDAFNTPEGSSTRKVHHRGEGFGYLLFLGGITLYFAGDTDLITEMSGLGRVDIALLPVGGTYVMDIPDSIKAAEIINPRLVIPMHEAQNDPQELEKSLDGHFTVIVLKPGETFEIVV
ncbi:MAG: MBL fold metallo-hydrolase [Youngiibacter sp.]|nr:MBL fold metallo-hydrolase [Youngiibacter sp.]